MQPDKDSDVTPRHRGKSWLRSLTDLLRLTTPTDPGGPAIVFIHIPKTAGTSFRAAAEQYFGNSSVERDYGAEDPYTTDIVLETVYSNRIEGLPTAMEQASRRMLAGHFPATKYHQLFANNVRWCTFLRDPVQRVISEHRHLVKKNRYAHSLEYFCNTKAECNKQTRLLRGIEEQDLYFVGVAEHFRASISVFNKLAGTRFKYTRTNVARKSLSEAYDVSDRVRKTIENNNRDDLALYSKHAARYAD